MAAFATVCIRSDNFAIIMKTYTEMVVSMTKSMSAFGSVRVAGALAEIPLREGLPAQRRSRVGVAASALVAGSCAMKRYPLYSTAEMESRRKAVLSHGRV